MLLTLCPLHEHLPHAVATTEPLELCCNQQLGEEEWTTNPQNKMKLSKIIIYSLMLLIIIITNN